jgi:hypothetical protein
MNPCSKKLFATNAQIFYPETSGPKSNPDTSGPKSNPDTSGPIPRLRDKFTFVHS